MAGHLLRERKSWARTLHTVDGMTKLFHSQGKYDDALVWYGRALIEKEKALGEDHADALVTVVNMALLYNSLGKYEVDDF